MKTFFNSLILCSIVLLSSKTLRAQYSELGISAKGSAGLIYGPVLNAKPLFKWGDSFETVHTLRAERSYLHYSRFEGNEYGSLALGGYYGKEWRKQLKGELYLTQGLEVGGYFTTTGPYTSLQPRVKYRFGLLYSIKGRVNISISTPISTGISIEKSDSNEWNQTLFTLDVFNEMNILQLTYILDSN